MIWGSTFWAITLQLGHAAPEISVTYRFALASLTLFAICRIRGDKLWLPWKQQINLLTQGSCSFALSYVCTYLSEQYLISALVSVLFTLLVIWNPIGEKLFFGKALTWRIWWAGMISLLGVVFLFWNSLRASWLALFIESSHGQSKFLLGLALALLATLASTAGNLLVVKVRQQNKNVFLTTAWAMLWGSALVALYASIRGLPWVLPVTPKYWVSLIYLAIFGSVIAFTAYFELMHRWGSHKAVYVGVITPVISVLLSMQFENYRPGPIEWLGMGLCLAGVALILRGEEQTTETPALPSTQALNQQTT